MKRVYKMWNIRTVLSVVLLVGLVFVVAASGCAVASNSEQAEDPKCREIWQELWPKIEAGDVEARGLLLGQMYQNALILPGRTYEGSLRLWDVCVLTIHSFPAKELGKKTPDWPETFLRLCPQHLTKTDAYKEYLSCISSGSSPDCTKGLVEENLIPDFADFIAYVNRQIAGGKHPQCRFPPGMSKLDFKPNTKQKTEE